MCKQLFCLFYRPIGWLPLSWFAVDVLCCHSLCLSWCIGWLCVYLRCSYDVPLVRASLITSRCAVRDQSGDPFRLRSWYVLIRLWLPGPSTISHSSCILVLNKFIPDFQRWITAKKRWYVPCWWAKQDGVAFEALPMRAPSIHGKLWYSIILISL